MSQLGMEPGPPWWKASTLEKRAYEQLVNSYSEYLHMNARPVENARDPANIFKPTQTGINRSK
jgi:hypothetical protein